MPVIDSFNALWHVAKDCLGNFIRASYGRQQGSHGPSQIVGRPIRYRHDTTIINDTRKLSKAAAALYAGVKETKDGAELLTHDKRGALHMMWQHQSLYEVDNAQKGPTKALRREEQDVLYAKARQDAEDSRKAMAERRKKLEADDLKERSRAH